LYQPESRFNPPVHLKKCHILFSFTAPARPTRISCGSVFATVILILLRLLCTALARRGFAVELLNRI
jgi:hypothetical protein